MQSYSRNKCTNNNVESLYKMRYGIKNEFDSPSISSRKVGEDMARRSSKESSSRSSRNNSSRRETRNNNCSECKSNKSSKESRKTNR